MYLSLYIYFCISFRSFWLMLKTTSTFHPRVIITIDYSIFFWWVISYQHVQSFGMPLSFAHVYFDVGLRRLFYQLRRSVLGFCRKILLWYGSNLKSLDSRILYPFLDFTCVPLPQHICAGLPPGKQVTDAEEWGNIHKSWRSLDRRTMIHHPTDVAQYHVVPWRHDAPSLRFSIPKLRQDALHVFFFL